MAPTSFYSTVAAGVKPFLRASVNAVRGCHRADPAKDWNATTFLKKISDQFANADAFATAFGDVIAFPIGFGRTKPAANHFGEGGVAKGATGFAKHQLEGPSNKPLGSVLYR